MIEPNMKKIMIQFHATLEELVDFINSTSSELNLNIAIITLSPFSLEKVNNELSVEQIQPNKTLRIIFTDEKAIIDTFLSNRSYDLSSGITELRIGHLTKEGLNESALAFMCNNAYKASIANKLALKLKKITKAGAIAVNPVNGAEASIRNHRYTDGARAIYHEGIKILPIAGHSFLKFPN